MDFHQAPFRRWQVELLGRTTTGLSEGTSYIFGPGEVRLIEGVPGKGDWPIYRDRLAI